MTHVRVSLDTLALLEKRKKELGLRSVDAVIQQLCVRSRDASEEGPASESDGEGGIAPQKRRRIDVRDALYSLEILSERRGMLEYYTGFDRPAVDLLIKRFREVSWRTPVFFIFVAALELEAVHAYPHFPLTFPM